MEAKYLKDKLGCLTICLKEVAEKRPPDPIEYIAFWLKKHIENEHFKSKKTLETEQYERLKVEYGIEQARKAKRLEEARRFAEEEIERLKLEQERKSREAAAASKLSMVEEKDENGTPRDALVDEKVDEAKEEEEEEHAPEEDGTEQVGDKNEQEDGDSLEEISEVPGGDV